MSTDGPDLSLNHAKRAAEFDSEPVDMATLPTPDCKHPKAIRALVHNGGVDWVCVECGADMPRCKLCTKVEVQGLDREGVHPAHQCRCRPNEGQLVRFKSTFTNRKNKYRNQKKFAWYGPWNFYYVPAGNGLANIQGRTKGYLPMVLEVPDHKEAHKQAVEVITRRIKKGYARKDDGIVYSTKYGQLDYIRAIARIKLDDKNDDVEELTAELVKENMENPDDVPYLQYLLHDCGLSLRDEDVTRIWIASCMGAWEPPVGPGALKVMDNYVCEMLKD